MTGRHFGRHSKIVGQMKCLVNTMERIKEHLKEYKYSYLITLITLVLTGIYDRTRSFWAGIALVLSMIGLAISLALSIRRLNGN